MKHPPLLKNKILSLHYKLVISVAVMHCFAFTFVMWHILCVMDAGTAQPTVSLTIKVIRKCVYFMKLNRSAVQLFKAANLADFYVTINFILVIVLL